MLIEDPDRTWISRPILAHNIRTNLPYVEGMFVGFRVLRSEPLKSSGVTKEVHMIRFTQLSNELLHLRPFLVYNQPDEDLRLLESTRFLRNPLDLTPMPPKNA